MLELLKARFRENKNLHIELNWLDVEKRDIEKDGGKRRRAGHHRL